MQINGKLSKCARRKAASPIFNVRKFGVKRCGLSAGVYGEFSPKTGSSVLVIQTAKNVTLPTVCKYK